MKLTISDKSKKDIFISIFQLLKSSSNIVNVIFKEDQMYIQGMDNCHILLFEIVLLSCWFDSYLKQETEHSNICFNTNIFHTIISISQEQDTIVIYYDGVNGEPEAVNIDIESEKKGEYNKYFKLPLTDLEADLLSIPSSEYDADFTINAKKMLEITSQLMKFGGESLDIICTEEKISITSTGGSCEMLVNIPIDDLSEYSIAEDDKVELSFSLNLINKMCLTTKLTPEIAFSISNELPMRIKYDIGDEGKSYVVFYVAPKINDDDK